MFGPRLVILLLCLLATPLLFSIGPLRLSPYRLFLIVAFAPLLFMFLSGRAGKLLAIDWLIIFAVVWAVCGLLLNHGFAFTAETGGIFVAECLGGYLLGRVCIRTPEAFGRMVKAHLFVVAAILPFAAIEAFANRTPLLDLFDAIGQSFSNNPQEKRLGMHRAQAVFEHPILYGVFAMSCMGAAFYVFQRSVLKRLFAYLTGCLSVVFSVSTGAIAGLVMLTFFIGWEAALKTVKARWRILTVLGVLGYIAVDALSNRTPFHVFVDYLTLNSGSAYNRILIFEFGTAEIARNPVFGIGYHEWTRPPWMSGSFDNFWLLNCMRYGLPMGLALILAIALLLRRVARRSFQDRSVWACQAGFLTSMAGLIFAGATVHYWNASFVWLMCFIGAGVWLATYREAAPSHVTFAAEVDEPHGGYRSLGREAALRARSPQPDRFAR